MMSNSTQKCEFLIVIRTMNFIYFFSISSWYANSSEVVGLTLCHQMLSQNLLHSFFVAREDLMISSVKM